MNCHPSVKKGTRWMACGFGHHPRTIRGDFGPKTADHRTIGNWVDRGPRDVGVAEKLARWRRSAEFL